MPVNIFIQVPRGEDVEALEREIHPQFDERPGKWFVSIVEPRTSPDWHVRIEGPNGFVWSRRFSGPEEVDPVYVGRAIGDAFASRRLIIRGLGVEGFGPFHQTFCALNALEVFVGANGSGKTTLLELLRAVRDFHRMDIPPELPNALSSEGTHRVVALL